jgi:hypothetical protein
VENPRDLEGMCGEKRAPPQNGRRADIKRDVIGNWSVARKAVGEPPPSKGDCGEVINGPLGQVRVGGKYDRLWFENSPYTIYRAGCGQLPRTA